MTASASFSEHLAQGTRPNGDRRPPWFRGSRQFVAVDRRIYDHPELVTGEMRNVYVEHVYHADSNTGRTTVGLETIGDRLGIKPRRVSGLRRALAGLGLLKIEHRPGKSDLVWVL